MERLKRGFKEAPKYALPAVFLGLGAYALLHKEYFIAAAGGILGWLTWPKKESGAAHMSALSSTGSHRAAESSYSLGRITQAESALPKAA